MSLFDDITTDFGKKQLSYQEKFCQEKFPSPGQKFEGHYQLWRDYNLPLDYRSFT